MSQKVSKPNVLLPSENDKVSIEEVVQSHVQPFSFVKVKGKFKICVGNSLISDREFDSSDDCESYLDSKPYELIINLCAFVCSHINSIKE